MCQKLKEYELERIANKLLASAGRDADYPFYSESALAWYSQRRGEFTHDTEELIREIDRDKSCTLYSHDSLMEVMSLLTEIAQYSCLDSREQGLLKMMIEGYTAREIANLCSIPLISFERQIDVIRKKLKYRVSPYFWKNMHKVTIYHRPHGVWDRRPLLEREGIE